jgi:hypothetical protein
MPIKIIADYRELLVDIFFAIIITIGFDGFLHDFFLKNVVSLNSFDLPLLLTIFSVPEFVIGTLFFFAAYFWVISHWIFYHELIEKYPYYNTWKFFVDITLFSIMFVVVNISYSAYEFTSLFILLVAIWYFFACLWHLSDNGLRPVKRYLQPHIKRMVTYAILLVLLYDPLSVTQIAPWYRYVIMASVIVAMITFNVHRLSKFMGRDLREYTCVYMQGYPDWNSPYKAGRLELERYPMKEKVGLKPKKDAITFKPDGSSSEIIIPAENIIKVTLGTLENYSHADDLMLQIECKDKNEEKIKIVLNLSDKIIKGVEKGIKDLSKDNKKMSLK